MSNNEPVLGKFDMRIERPEEAPIEPILYVELMDGPCKGTWINTGGTDQFRRPSLLSCGMEIGTYITVKGNLYHIFGHVNAQSYGASFVKITDVDTVLAAAIKTIQERRKNMLDLQTPWGQGVADGIDYCLMQLIGRSAQ